MSIPALHESLSIHLSLSLGLFGLIYVALVDTKHKYRILERKFFVWPFFLLIGLFVIFIYNVYVQFPEFIAVDLKTSLTFTLYFVEAVVVFGLTVLIGKTYNSVRKSRGA